MLILMLGLRSFGKSLLIFFGATFVVYSLVIFSPGWEALEQEQTNNVVISEITGARNNPSIIHYFNWIKHAIMFDFGNSAYSGYPVVNIMSNRLVISSLLIIFSLLTTLTFSFAISMFLIYRKGHWQINLPLYGILLFSIVPIFWSSYYLIYLIRSSFPQLVFGGYVQESGIGWNTIRHIVIPAIMLGFGSGLLIWTTYDMKHELEQIRSAEYVQAAISRGVPGYHHMIKPLILLVTNITTVRIGYFIGGSIVVEKIFNVHGLGWLTLEAAENRDMQLILGITMVTTSIVIVLNFFKDLVQLFIDPRIRNRALEK